jgi:hypothetical protein
MYVYIYNIGTNILTEKCNGEIFEGGSCKTMVFYSSSRVPPKKNQLPMLEEPLLVSYPCGK